MLNKIKKCCLIAMLTVFTLPAMAVEVIEDVTVENEDIWAEDMSAEAIANYDVNGSLFQRITDLEQEKVLMQLEKERAQLDLELDRLAAEKIKLHMEIDTLSGRAEEQQAAIEAERAKLEVEAARLAREKKALEEGSASDATSTRRAVARTQSEQEVDDEPLSDKYRLIEIVGMGNQLQATVEDVNGGQRKKISVGKTLDGYTVKSISLDEGVIFTKDGATQTLSISKAN